jgi:hypothetical protein
LCTRMDQTLMERGGFLVSFTILVVLSSVGSDGEMVLFLPETLSLLDGGLL